MLAKKVRDLGLDRLGQQSTRPIAQDFGELIVDVSWLNQLDDVIFGHGISLRRWRSGGVKHPHNMPPSQFPPHAPKAFGPKLPMNSMFLAPLWFMAALIPMVASQVVRLQQLDPAAWIAWDYAGRLGALAVLAAIPL